MIVFVLMDFEVVIFWVMVLLVKVDVDVVIDMVECLCVM